MQIIRGSGKESESSHQITQKVIRRLGGTYWEKSL